MMSMMAPGENSYESQSNEDSASSASNQYGSGQNKNGANNKQSYNQRQQQSSNGYGNQGAKYEEPQVSSMI